MRTLLLSALAAALSVAMAAPSSLAASAHRFAIADVSFVAFNPCTGNDTTITLTNQVLVIHDVLDANMGQHAHGTITGDAENSDGFSGRFTNTFGMNLRDISDPLVQGEFVVTISAIVHDASGRAASLHELFHITIPSGPVGVLTGSVDAFSLKCLGKPS